MKKKSIPGWTIDIEEVSNGVFKVTLTDVDGRKTETVDNAADETIERTIGDAFEIEKQVSKNWNLFLYDLAIQKLGVTDIKTKQYNDQLFGSWFIERHDRRLVYDGKDSWLVFQTRQKTGWNDIEIIKKKELQYSNFVSQINMLTENTPHNSSFPNPTK
jgi:hypothetical protein